MKKIILVAAALLACSLCFAEKSADLKGTPATSGSVNASWDWNGRPKGSKIGEDSTVFSKAYEIAPTSGSGAKFEIIKGETKFKTENGITALYHNNSPSVTMDNIEKKRKAEYAITLDDAATIELTVTGNGFGEQCRMVVVKNGDDVVVFADSLNKENPDEVLTITNAPKGTYRVLVNGSRIVKLNVKN